MSWSPLCFSLWRHIASTSYQVAIRFYEPSTERYMEEVKGVSLSDCQASKNCFLLQHTCIIAVRKLCGLKRPPSHTAAGNWKSAVQFSSSLIRSNKSAYLKQQKINGRFLYQGCNKKLPVQFPDFFLTLHDFILTFAEVCTPQAKILKSRDK